ncbi:MAG: teichoic-acid-transporting ATPase [Anaerolineae bacterium]|nr:MAG: teichoic-acid-transporting ATPase [Anaerolineae bacterium]
MNDIAIRVENLSKRYTIGRARQRHDTLRDSLAGLFSRKRGDDTDDTFWALRDVSFEIKPGEVVGIIGHNGAGKSTLLKILSQITEPTGGRAEIHGRVGSLLEVGTGFHPELTGRENIYLNGAILGMRREEIARKFDEIVAFSEVEKFLDTPVKRYSSGMYVRLAFAVAAYLEPEILLVDEVLAVGDASFQKKALGKMGTVVNEGRTVLFVSHNMDAIQRLCRKGILMNKGEVELFGDVASVIERYKYDSTRVAAFSSWTCVDDVQRIGDGWARFAGVRIFGDEEGKGEIVSGGQLHAELLIQSNEARTVSSLAITVFDQNGTKLINADSISKGLLFSVQEGLNKCLFVIDELHLNPGTYVLGLWMSNYPGQVIDWIPAAILFDVAENVTPQMFGIRADGIVPCTFELSLVDSTEEIQS